MLPVWVCWPKGDDSLCPESAQSPNIHRIWRIGFLHSPNAENSEKNRLHAGEELMVFWGGGFTPGFEVGGEGGSFEAGKMGEDFPVFGVLFEEGKDEVGEGSV